jgi:hypothetical protein
MPHPGVGLLIANDAFGGDSPCLEGSGDEVSKIVGADPSHERHRGIQRGDAHCGVQTLAAGGHFEAVPSHVARRAPLCAEVGNEVGI